MTEVRVRKTDAITVRGLTGAVGLPGTDSIGMGYDVFRGLFASPEATTRRLFDLGPAEDFEISEGTYIKPKAVLVQTLQEGGITRTEGKTSQDYQADRAVNLYLHLADRPVSQVPVVARARRGPDQPGAAGCARRPRCDAA